MVEVTQWNPSMMNPVNVLKQRCEGTVDLAPLYGMGHVQDVFVSLTASYPSFATGTI